MNPSMASIHQIDIYTLCILCRLELMSGSTEFGIIYMLLHLYTFNDFLTDKTDADEKLREKIVQRLIKFH